MNEKEMKKELETLSTRDNPFDALLYEALEIARTLLFSRVRYRVNTLPIQLSQIDGDIRLRTNKILKIIGEMENLSDETVQMCRETSCYYGAIEFDLANQALLNLEKELETVYTRCVPCHDDTFDKARLGEDSEEYKRHKELQEILTDIQQETTALKIFTKKSIESYLCNLIDVIDRGEQCVEEGWMSEETLKRLQDIIEKHHLSEHDVEYIKSYFNKKEV